MAKIPTTPPAKRTRAKPAAAKAATPRAPRKAAAKTPARAKAATPVISANTAWSIGAVVVAAGAGLAAFLTRGRIAAALAPAEGHVPTDLLDPERNADDRAVADFRPDMDAVMTASEREALRPPVGKPSMTASNGSMNSLNAPLN